MTGGNKSFTAQTGIYLFYLKKHGFTFNIFSSLSVILHTKKNVIRRAQKTFVKIYFLPDLAWEIGSLAIVVFFASDQLPLLQARNNIRQHQGDSAKHNLNTIFCWTRQSILGSNGMMKSDCFLFLLSDFYECLLMFSESSWSQHEVNLRSTWTHPGVVWKSSWSHPDVIMKNLRLKDEDCAI